MKLFEHTEEETVELMRKVCAEHNLKLTFMGEDEGMGGFVRVPPKSDLR
jgi:hypothetical protein